VSPKERGFHIKDRTISGQPKKDMAWTEYLDIPENANSGKTSRSKFCGFALLSTASARLRLLSTSPTCGANFCNISIVGNERLQGVVKNLPEDRRSSSLMILKMNYFNASKVIRLLARQVGRGTEIK
jgi:hypothetical protein